MRIQRHRIAPLNLEHFPEKRVPVFRRKCDQIKNPERLSDSMEAESALVACDDPGSRNAARCWAGMTPVFAPRRVTGVGIRAP
jgi:hypothetical protein